ncbi:MAG: DUF4437 domain-containing protein [Pseudomonadota bacterium]
MSRTALLAAAVLAAAPLLTHADPIRLLYADDADWKTTPQGVAFAALQGDRFSEPYQALVRLPAGTVSPAHTKSANMFGVMIAGEMIHHTDTEDPAAARRIGPGAFYSIAAGTPHVSACVSATPCVAYLYQDGAFDFVPVAQ